MPKRAKKKAAKPLGNKRHEKPDAGKTTSKTPPGIGPLFGDKSEAIPPAAPPGPAPSPDPVMDPFLVAPPEGTFATAPEPGSLAHALMQRENSVARTVIDHIAKPREPWWSEWNSASEIGDPCLRKIAYARLHPDKALPTSPELAFTFKHGNWIEREAYDELFQAGVEIVEQQRPFVDQRLKIKGKIDGKVVKNLLGKRWKLPIDIKGYAPGTWAFDTPKDFLDAGRPYLKKVPAQITAYMMLDENRPPAGLIYIKNKMSAVPKEVVFPFDQGYAEWLERRVLVLNEHVQAKKLPHRIEFAEECCGHCEYRAVCLGEMPAGGAPPQVLRPEQYAELHELLQERERTWETKAAAEKIDRRIGDLVKGHAKIILGNYIVTGRWVSSTRLDQDAMPEDIRTKFAKESTYWKKSIVNVKAAQKPDE